MNNDLQKPPLSWALISVFLIFSAITTIIGVIFTENQRTSLLEDKKNELKAIADLKVGQIKEWRKERLADAILIRDNYSLVDEINKFLNNSDNQKEEERLISWMKSITANYDYFSAIIIDKNGKARLGLSMSDSLIGASLRPMIPNALKEGEIILTDLHRAHKMGSIHLDLIIPLFAEGNNSSAIGLVVLRIDPQKVLFPLVQSWPTQSKTSETLLLERDGDSVVYLNELKHLKNTALSFRKPISDSTFIGTRAVRGLTGVAEGIDYRGAGVIAAVEPVSGTPWYMVSKVDTNEITSQLKSQLLIIRLLMIFMVCAFGAVIGWMVWHQRVRFYRNRYLAEVEKRALRTHFDYLLKYANDIVLLIDENLNIVEVNDRAIEYYQYTREEIIGMDVKKLRIPEQVHMLDDKIAILKETGSTTYETIHQKKDGLTFPVEISARLFEIEGVKYYQSIGRDITERKKIESNLNILLERYNLATKAANLAVWEWDVVDDVLIWDDRVFELFGVKKGDYPPVFESWLKILHPEDVEKAKTDIENVVMGIKNYDTEFRVIMPDCSIKNIKAYGHVVRNEVGAPVRMIGINFDITEQKTADNLLREREFWLTESQKVGKIGSYIFDIISMKWSSSEVLDEIFGINDKYERTLEGWDMIVHPDYRSEMLEYVKDHVILQKKSFNKEYKIQNQGTGEERWVDGRGELICGPDGNPVKLIGTIQDITDRKKAELLLNETEQTYLGLFNTVSDAIYIHKIDGVFMDVNSGAEEMYGYSREEMIGKTPFSVSAPGRNDMNQLEVILKRVMESGISEKFEFWGQRKNGELFPKEVVSNRGKYFGQDVIISTARDITERKIAENLLIESKEKAEESDRLKTAFLHNISHEIRTPMNAIVGFTALLDEPDIDPASRKQFMNIITQSTNQLLSIISDIVDVSNIETNQVKLNITEVDINNVIRDLYELYKLTAEQQKLLFHYDIKLADNNAVIHTDKTKLIQIISNLLNNAFKFTRQGTIEFGYLIKNNELEFFVSDTGIGVPEDKKYKIFDRFYQVENHSSRQYSGAGLGLSICKAYAEILGGKIWVESKPGQGSRFNFSIPL